MSTYIYMYLLSFICVPDSPGCVCGFMSVERMRILLRLDTVGNLRGGQQRQQITPDMKFTCDGLITKWIVGADWHNDDYLYPELQVWRRNVVNNTYHKINGTFLNIETQSSNRIYEYEDFPPIPVQAGDVLGAFIPRNGDNSNRARLRLLSERDYGPTNYYIQTGRDDAVSSYDTIDIDTIDIDSTPSLESEDYQLLVTVEISEFYAIQRCTCTLWICTVHIRYKV